MSLLSLVQPERLTWLNYTNAIPRYDRSPEQFKRAFRKARYWHDCAGSFIKSVIGLKTDFFNYGFSLVSKERGESEQLKAALSNPAKKNNADEQNVEDAITELVASVWGEFLTLDNCILYWRTDGALPPLTLAPERCEFRDDLGIPILRYSHDLTAEQKKLLEPDVAERFAQGVIQVGYRPSQNGSMQMVPIPEEKFRVIRRVPTGYGFGWPTLLTIEHALDQCLSLEVAEQQMAFLMRSIYRRTKIGHEIKNGPKAGSSDHFWKAKKAADIKKAQEGAVGIIDQVVNFDQTTVIEGWPDVKVFDPSKWLSPRERFTWWAGPVGWMLVLEHPNPYLMPLLKAQAIAERAKIAPHLNALINGAFDLPECQVKWSNRIFADASLAADMVKFWTQQGPMSLRTGLNESGYDLDEEVTRKREEMALEESKEGLLKPIFDAAHGDQQANGNQPAGRGRPAGSNDPQNRT